MRPSRVGVALLIPALSIAFGLWLSLRPLFPSGSEDRCGNAWRAVSLDTSGDYVVPTVGQLCHPLGVGRFDLVAAIILVGLLVGLTIGMLEYRRSRTHVVAGPR